MPCSDSVFHQLFTGTLIECSDTFKDYQTSQGQSQVQTVADNASTYYGADSAVAQAAQEAADNQKSQVAKDVKSITDAIADDADTGCVGVDLTIFGGPCVDTSFLKWAGISIAVVAAFVGFIYVYSFTAPFRSVRL